MKNIKLLRILRVCILLSLLLVVLPASPAQAVREITLSPIEGAVGTRITIAGTEFNKSTANADKYTAIFFSSDEASTIDDIDVEVTHYKLLKEGVWLDEDGDFETTTIESDISINPNSGETGTSVIISGTGFGKIKAVTIWFSNTVVATTTMSIVGSFYTNFNVPDIQAGRYNVDAEQGINIAKTRFTITEPPPPPPLPQTPPFLAWVWHLL